MANIVLASSLRSAASKMCRMLKKQIKSAGDLSLTEITTLSNLYQHQLLYPSQMAEMVKVKAQSMSQVINQLDELKLIIKTPSDTDKRKVAISLSGHGKHMIEQTRYERDEWLNDAIEHHLTAAEKKTLQEAVAIIDRLADYK